MPRVKADAEHARQAPEHHPGGFVPRADDEDGRQGTQASIAPLEARIAAAEDEGDVGVRQEAVLLRTHRM